VVTAFSIPSTSTSLLVSVTSFTASDNKSVTGYLLTESSTTPLAANAGWTATAPSSYSFSSEGTKTLYAYIKDAAGNVSAGVNAQVTIEIIRPAIIEFNVQDTSEGLTVPIIKFEVNDTNIVKGYLIKETSDSPDVNDLNWSSNAPATYSFSENQTGLKSANAKSGLTGGEILKTLYAWTKCAGGNISACVSDQVVIVMPDETKPLVTAFAIPSTSTSLTVSVTSFTVSDNKGVTGYLLTESSTAPMAANLGWTAASPTTYTFASEGTKTLYAWAKDAAGNVSANRIAQVTIALPLKNDGTAGSTTIYDLTTTVSNRRAQQVSFGGSGSIHSITIFHNGGTGNVILGVYSDNSGSPQSLLGVTPSTAINSSPGWQTISLSTPVSVSAGETVWLAWVFQNNPGIRYTNSTTTRAQSLQNWSAGMPEVFGSSSFANHKYSIYCTYEPEFITTSNAGNEEVFNLTTTVSNRRAQQVTFSESGKIQNITIFHDGGTGNVILGVYSDNSGSPHSLLGVTSSTAINSSPGWQTISLSTPVNVSAGETVWLAWVFQNNPGLRYTNSTSTRAQSIQNWSAGMPKAFGSSTFDNYKYSIYCTYTANTKSGEIMTETEPVFEKVDIKVFPNPFSDRLRFEFVSPESVNARIDLFDMSGRMIKNIFEQPIEGGISYEAEFRSETILNGMYIYRLIMGETVYNGKVVFKK
jgi:hypothetical protein